MDDRDDDFEDSLAQIVGMGCAYVVAMVVLTAFLLLVTSPWW